MSHNEVPAVFVEVKSLSPCLLLCQPRADEFNIDTKFAAAGYGIEG